MSWGYRVLNDPNDEDGEPFSIVEAIYDEDEAIVGWSTPHPLKDESIHGLIGQIMVMLNAAIEARGAMREVQYGPIVPGEADR